MKAEGMAGWRAAAVRGHTQCISCAQVRILHQEQDFQKSHVNRKIQATNNSAWKKTVPLKNWLEDSLIQEVEIS